ncbi:MAG: DUF2799 domain-containing protein [Alphaproteobacteria bacterium]
MFKTKCRLFLVLGVGLMGLSACTSMSAEECAVADWREVGHTDAARGFGSDRIEDHRRACADAGIAPDLDGYLAGFAKGLPLYCTRQRGFDLAANGGGRPSQCDRREFGDFQQGFDRGEERYRLTREIDRLSEDLTAREQIASDLAQQIADLTTRIDSGNEPAATREDLIRQRNSLSTLFAEQQDKLTYLRDEIAYLQDDADAIRP